MVSDKQKSSCPGYRPSSHSTCYLEVQKFGQVSSVEKTLKSKRIQSIQGSPTSETRFKMMSFLVNVKFAILPLEIGGNRAIQQLLQGDHQDNLRIHNLEVL